MSLWIDMYVRIFFDLIATIKSKMKKQPTRFVVLKSQEITFFCFLDLGIVDKKKEREKTTDDGCLAFINLHTQKSMRGVLSIKRSLWD